MKSGISITPSVNGNVVIVEDDPILGDLLLEIMEEAGASCLLFTQADDALMHLLQSGQQCLMVITDYLVPGQINGIELATIVSERWPETALILTTGYTLDHTPLPTGVLFLQKPWAIDQFMATVTTALKASVGAA